MQASHIYGSHTTVMTITAVMTIVVLFIASHVQVGPVYGQSVPSPLITDITISDAVEDELLLDPTIRSHLIDVTTKEGMVTLSGSVDNLMAKTRAVHIAEAVKGVRAVINTIKVLSPVLRSDEEI